MAMRTPAEAIQRHLAEKAPNVLVGEWPTWPPAVSPPLPTLGSSPFGPQRVRVKFLAVENPRH